jgi:hypothetical protein
VIGGNLMRAFIAREGFSGKDDVPPPRLHDETKVVSPHSAADLGSLLDGTFGNINRTTAYR